VTPTAAVDISSEPAPTASSDALAVVVSENAEEEKATSRSVVMITTDDNRLQTRPWLAQDCAEL